jgi:hypothetical protein
MPFSTNSHCRSVASYLTARNNIRQPLLKLLVAGVFTMLSTNPVFAGSMPPANQLFIAPHQATYISQIKDIHAELDQSLSQREDGQWQINNEVTAVFSSVTESSQFYIIDGQIAPVSYRYKNPLSKKRSSKLQFTQTGEQLQATEILQEKASIDIPSDSLDKLSFQLQLRLDMIASEGEFSSKDYHLVEQDSLKTYTVKKLSEEIIDTAAGSFKTIKLEQRRAGKDKHSLIWLAKDKQYFLLRVQRIKKSRVEYQVDLSQADIDGVTLTP